MAGLVIKAFQLDHKVVAVAVYSDGQHCEEHQFAHNTSQTFGDVHFYEKEEARKRYPRLCDLPEPFCSNHPHLGKIKGTEIYGIGAGSNQKTYWRSVYLACALHGAVVRRKQWSHSPLNKLTDQAFSCLKRRQDTCSPPRRRAPAQQHRNQRDEWVAWWDRSSWTSSKSSRWVEDPGSTGGTWNKTGVWGDDSRPPWHRDFSRNRRQRDDSRDSRAASRGRSRHRDDHDLKEEELSEEYEDESLVPSPEEYEEVKSESSRCASRSSRRSSRRASRRDREEDMEDTRAKFEELHRKLREEALREEALREEALREQQRRANRGHIFTMETLRDGHASVKVHQMPNGQSLVVDFSADSVATTKEKSLSDFTLVYCGTAQWFDPAVRNHSNREIWDWIKEEQNGVLMTLMERGATVRFLIVGKKSLPDDELDVIVDFLKSSMTGREAGGSRVAALGCSAGGMLALRLLKAGLGALVAAVSPAPLGQSEWEEVARFSAALASTLHGSRERTLHLIWGSEDKTQEHLRSLQQCSAVQSKEIPHKGHIGILSTSLFEEILRMLVKGKTSQAQAEPVPNFPEDAESSTPRPPPRDPRAQTRSGRREGILLRVSRKSRTPMGELYDVETAEQFVFEYFNDLGDLKVGEKYTFSVAEGNAVNVVAAQKREFALPKPSEDMIFKAKQFLWRHAIRDGDETAMTHSSMRGFRDPNTNSGKFSFWDNRQSRWQLAEAIATCHLASTADPHTSSELKLFLCEHPTKVQAFVEDIDILGGQTGGSPEIMKRSDSLEHDFELLKYRAKALKKVFPTAQMRVVVYEASGFYTGSGTFKESYHLVWPWILVSKEQAAAARIHAVKMFEKLSQKDHPLARLLAKIHACCDKNAWATVFDETTTRPSVGARMPFCDKRSKHFASGDWVDENRKVLPVAELEFDDFSDDIDDEILPSIRIVNRPQDKTPAEWIYKGMCRRSEDEQKNQTYCAAALPPKPKKVQRPPGSGSGSGRPGPPGPGKGGPPGPPGKGGGKGGQGGWKGGKGNKGHGKSWHSHQESEGYDQGGRSRTPPLKERRFFSGTQSQFLDGIRANTSCHWEKKTIQGGIQVMFYGRGNINFFCGSGAVLVQGNNHYFLHNIIKSWTTEG